MAKALTGKELDLDDGPAHGCDLFLVDGNNLAYRAYFALPEELATSEGLPTNALLGFANMLFKLLVDYKPRGVAVAWDTRPVERLAMAEDYKGERKPMPDFLSQQFPFFRPIVQAFGYENLAFEGWEADDVIATLATQADVAQMKVCVVSTDRDAFQLVSDNVCLMMTPRGVSDVQVYTPSRVEDRYGIKPLQIPDFIGLKGDTSDNIPGVPGIGEKTAAQLLQKYGTLGEVIAHASELPPARSKAIREHVEQARGALALATMRRDLELGCHPTTLVLAPPDRSRMREMFRRFEFKGLLKRVDLLDQALPAAARQVVGTEAVWREGDIGEDVRGRAALAVQGGRFALAQEDGVVVGTWRPEFAARLRSAELVAHDAKALPVDVVAADDTAIAAYLIEPARPTYPIDELATEYGLEVRPSPTAPDEATAALIRAAEAPRRLAPRLRERLRERGTEKLYDEIELPLTRVLASMEAAGVRIDLTRLTEITRELETRVRELEAKAHDLAGESFVLASPKQLAHVLFEKLGLAPGRKTKTGYSTDTRVLRAIAGEHAIVPIVTEWRELSTLLHVYLEPLPTVVSSADGRIHATFHQTSAATGRLTTSNPNLQAIPVRTELGRRIRAAFVSAPGCVFLSADYSQVELRVLAHASREPSLLDAFARGDDIHTVTAAEVLGKERAAVTDAERTIAKRVNFGILYGISAFGLSESIGIPRDEAQRYIDAYLERLPAVRAFIGRTIEDARRDGFVTTLLGRRRPVPEIRASNRQTRALGERLAVNSVVQGTVADVMKIAMVRIHARLLQLGGPGAEAEILSGAGRSTPAAPERSLRDAAKARAKPQLDLFAAAPKPELIAADVSPAQSGPVPAGATRSRIVLQVHDELLLEVPEQLAGDVRAIVAHEMSNAFLTEPTLDVDVGVGHDWSEAKRGKDHGPEDTEDLAAADPGEP